MTFNQIKMAIYATFLTNYYGVKLKLAPTLQAKKVLRIAYSKTLLGKLNIQVTIKNAEKLPHEGPILLACNHRSILDPLVVELLMENIPVYGDWISKKELYNSFFFGLFVRNGGSVLIDRDSNQMSNFFADIKESVKEGASIYIFPEGTRNKSEKALGEFLGGAQLIAVKNRLPIVPVFIRTNVNEVLKSALQNPNKSYTIEVEAGDVIDYKDRKESLETRYKATFNLQ